MQTLVSFIIFVTIYIAKVRMDIYDPDNEFASSQVILFYSPLDSELIRGQIVIYWYIQNYIENDTLALYYGHPDLNEIQPIFRHRPDKKSGVIKTGVPPTRAYYSLDLSYVEQCTGYYGTWLRNNSVKKLSCLSTHPDWMSKQKHILKYMTIGNLFIPGTHNSGSYSEDSSQTIVQRYTVTQDKSVLDQLISGARYLDIRPCIYDSQYWVCHGRFRMHLFDKIIQDIKDFMEHTDEIVIVSFKEFPQGFTSAHDHEIFIDYLLVTLRDYVLPRPMGVERAMTLNRIWESGRRLIISYNHDLRTLNQNELLVWSPIIQEWGNVNSDEQLKKFINRYESYAQALGIFTEDSRVIRTMMAEITLDATSIIKDSIAHIFGKGQKSLRQIGVQVGLLITAWYNEQYFSSANIVAADFIDATGIVQVAIQWNKMRADYFYQNYVKDSTINKN